MAKFKSIIRHLTFQDGPQDGGEGKHPAPWAEFIDHFFETTDQAVIKRLRGLGPEHGVTEVPKSDTARTDSIAKSGTGKTADPGKAADTGKSAS